MIAWAFSFAVIAGAAAAGLTPFVLLVLPLPDGSCWLSPALRGISAQQTTRDPDTTEEEEFHMLYPGNRTDSHAARRECPCIIPAAHVPQQPLFECAAIWLDATKNMVTDACATAFSYISLE